MKFSDCPMSSDSPENKAFLKSIGYSSSAGTVFSTRENDVFWKYFQDFYKEEIEQTLPVENTPWQKHRKGSLLVIELENIILRKEQLS